MKLGEHKQCCQNLRAENTETLGTKQESREQDSRTDVGYQID